MNKTQLRQLLFGIRRFTHGSMGIGTMIVFIAMVLVAGIAASVLIQTSNQLETQALSTGRETRTEVSSDISVLSITGNFNNRTIGSTNYSRFHNMTIMVTARSASAINLDKVIIEISNDTETCILSWDNSKYAAQASSSGVFFTTGLFDLNASSFGIIVLEDSDGSCTFTDPVINQGDKVLLTVNLSAVFNGLPLREEVRGEVISEYGSPGVFLFRTPATNSRSIVDLM